MTLRSATKTLLILALALPVVVAVLLGVRGLLGGMGDDFGAAALGRLSLACLVAWSAVLVGLLLLLAVIAINERPPEE